MGVVRLDEEDLDEEDLAILAEVSKKGYYHGRPKNQAGPPPAKIDTTPQKLEASSIPLSRTAFDDFQRKWDRFDDDGYVKELERDTIESSQKASSSSASVLQKPLKLAFVAEFKVVLVGDGGVGKTALVMSHLSGEFERNWTRTAKEEVHQLRFHTNCGEVALNIWTVASGMAVQGQTQALRERIYSQGHAAIVMFDLTSRTSFRSVPNWQREIKQVLGSVPMVLLGNKVDATARQVTPKQINAHIRGALQYYGISVRNKQNFERPFLWLLRRLTNQPQLQFAKLFAKAPSQPSSSRSLPGHAAATRQLQEAQNKTVESETPL